MCMYVSLLVEKHKYVQTSEKEHMTNLEVQEDIFGINDSCNSIESSNPCLCLLLLLVRARADGSHLGTAQPQWSIQQCASCRAQKPQMGRHLRGTFPILTIFLSDCVQRFTPDGNQLITIGNQHDKSVVVWNWSKGQKIAENRVTSQVRFEQ